MNITLSRAALLEALSIASAPVDSDPSQPILATLRMIKIGDELEIVGSDAISVASIRVPAEGTDGGCCVKARTIMDRCKFMPDGTVRLRLDGGTLHVEGGTLRFAVGAQTADDYPKGVGTREANGEAIPVNVIATLLDRGACAMDDDRGAQPIKRVVAWTTTPDGWTELASACGGAAAASAVETGLPPNREVLVPHRGIEILRRFLSGKGSVRIEVDAGAAGVGTGGMIYATRESSTLGIRLADPSIAPPTGHQYRFFLSETERMAARIVTIHRAMALSAVTAVASASELHQLELYAGGGRLRIVGKGENGEPAEDEVLCQLDGDGSGEIRTILPGDRLAKMLTLATSERVSFRLGESLQPVILREVGELDARAWWLMLPIMPRSYETRGEARAVGAARAEKAEKAKRKPKGTGTGTGTGMDPNEPEETGETNGNA